MKTWPNHALQRTRPSRSGCNRGVPWAGVAELESFGNMSTLRRSNWRLGIFVLAAVPVFIFDIGWFSPCRCWYGAWDRFQGNAALLVLGLIALRFVAAWVFKEHNSGWKYYLALLIGSPFIVTAVFMVAKLVLPPELRVHPTG